MKKMKQSNGKELKIYRSLERPVMSSAPPCPSPPRFEYRLDLFSPPPPLSPSPRFEKPDLPPATLPLPLISNCMFSRGQTCSLLPPTPLLHFEYRVLEKSDLPVSRGQVWPLPGLLPFPLPSRLEVPSSRASQYNEWPADANERKSQGSTVVCPVRAPYFRCLPETCVLRALVIAAKLRRGSFWTLWILACEDFLWFWTFRVVRGCFCIRCIFCGYHWILYKGILFCVWIFC